MTMIRRALRRISPVARDIYRGIGAFHSLDGFAPSQRFTADREKAPR